MSVAFVVSSVCLFLFWGGKPGFLYHLISCTDDLQVAHLISCTTLLPVEMTSGGHLYRKSGGTGNQVGHLELLFVVSSVCLFLLWVGTAGFLYHLASCTDDLQVAHLISCTTLYPVEMPSGGHLNRKPGGTGNQWGHLEVISTGNQLEQEIRWATWGSSVQKPWMTGSFGEAVCIWLQLLYIFSNSTGGSNRAGLLWTKRLEWLFRAWVAVLHFCVVWHLVDPATKATWLFLPAVTAL